MRMCGWMGLDFSHVWVDGFRIFDLERDVRVLGFAWLFLHIFGSFRSGAERTWIFFTKIRVICNLGEGGQ